MTKSSFKMVETLRATSLRVAAIATCLAVGMMFWGCEEVEPEKSGAKRITDFSFTSPSAEGVIDQTAKTIAVTVPSGTNVTALAPTIKVSAGATVNPESGAAQNFTNPVKYTVTAEDGTTAEYTATVTVDVPKPVVLKSPITENTTLVDLGLPVDYVYLGDTELPLSVENNATLTIEPGVTIQFPLLPSESVRYALVIRDGATIKANGTSEKRIQFVGETNEKGSWKGIRVESMTDNQFAYCDFLNAGVDLPNCAALYLFPAKASITHCKFTNGKGYGLYLHNFGGDCQLTAFNNNVFEDFDEAPLYIYFAKLEQLDKFDMTSDFTKNKKAYIQLDRPQMDGDVTINQTTVPYYFDDYIVEINHTLTINEGVTIYMGEGGRLVGDPHVDSRLMINGTAAKKVKITRLPGETDNWDGIECGWLPGSVIKHCILEYGGNFTTGVIFLPVRSNLTLDNVEFRHTKTYDAVIPSGCRYIDIYVKHSNITYSRPSGNVHLEDWNIPPDFDNGPLTLDALPDYWE